MNRRAHKLNVPGDFYVEDGECISCGMPESESPNLVGSVDDPISGHHCFFKKQPQNDGEVRDAIRAMQVSCCSALRYRGNDKAIIHLISVAGELNQVDSSADSD